MPAAGRLPNVTFIEPNYTLVPELTGTSNDDHPHGSILSGEGWIADVYNAAARQPAVGSDGVRPQLRRTRRVL